MPEIARPGALRAVALDELREHDLDAPPGVDEPPGPGPFLIPPRLEGREQLQPLRLQALPEGRALQYARSPNAQPWVSVSSSGASATSARLAGASSRPAMIPGQVTRR